MNNNNALYWKGKLKGKAKPHPTTDQEGPEGRE